DAQPVGTALAGGACALGQPVAVPVGLDHRHHLRAGELLEPSRVVPHRGEVDHDLRPRGHRRITSGSARATSLATSGPPSEASTAAAPCSQAPTLAASYGVRPAASSAPTTPPTTSP